MYLYFEGIHAGIHGACSCVIFAFFRPIGLGVPPNGDGSALRCLTSGQIWPAETPSELARLPQSNSGHV